MKAVLCDRIFITAGYFLIKQTKQLSILLSVFTVFLFSSPDLIFAETSSLNIAMILWRGETKAEQGFKDGLREMGYTVQYRIMDADQNRNEVGRLLNQLSSQFDTFDYIYTFGTTVSRRARIIVNDRIPQIFNVVTDPVAAGIVDSMDASGGNVTGVSDAIPVARQIEQALEIITFKTIGFFFNPREKNSMIIRKEFYDVAKELGLDVVDLRSPPAQELLQTNLLKLTDKSIKLDAVYLPADSFLVSNADRIARYLKRAQIKSIGGTGEFIEHGVLLGIVNDYYQLGREAAVTVDRHQKGEKLETIPVVRGGNPYLMINKSTRDALHVTIPEAVLKDAVIVD